jgi:hypothetical protein
VTFQLAEVAVSRQMFAEILSLIAQRRAPPAPALRLAVNRDGALYKSDVSK